MKSVFKALVLSVSAATVAILAYKKGHLKGRVHQSKIDNDPLDLDRFYPTKKPKK